MRRVLPRALVFIIWALTAIALTEAAALAQGELNRVYGIVKDDTGAPVKGAIVRAYNPNAAPTTYTATTDEKGRFALLGLRRGVWTITASAPGFESEEISGPIQRGRPIPALEFSLRPKPASAPRGALTGVDVERLQASLREAESLEGSGKIDEALAVYEKTLVQVPALTAINGQMADLYLKKGEPEKALACYQKMLAADPDSAKAKSSVCDVAYALGLAAAQRNDAQAAEKYFEQSIAADPESARAVEARAALERLRRK